MKSLVWIWALVVLVVIGCGGSGTPGDGSTNGRGDVFGVLFDRNGSVVANARVWTNTVITRESTSNPTGTYVLEGVSGSNIIVQAEVFRNGIRYYGQNLATVTANQRESGINITLFNDRELGQLRGSITDASGNLIRGARVFAKITGGASSGTSTVALSGENGQYVLTGLGSGLTYQIQANALNYNSNTTTVSLGAGEIRNLDLQLPNAVTRPLVTPANLTAQSWTVPKNLTRSSPMFASIMAVKNYINPKTSQLKKTITRETPNGNLIEVDLFWDSMVLTHNLGFGIYRATGAGSLQDVGFLRDPLGSFFADGDARLTPGVDYTYGVTMLDTQFDGVTGESAMSNTVTINPLGDLTSVSISAGTRPRFTWSPANGATSYQVLIYDEQPSTGVVPIITSPASAATSFDLASSLSSGRNYWAIVIGSNTFGDKSVSQLFAFVP